MDETLKEKIRILAQENGLDPKEIETLFYSGDIPQELEQAMGEVFGALGAFDGALKEEDE